MSVWGLLRKIKSSPVLDPRQRGPSSGERAVRLFISSAFRDLEPERESLRRLVYPIVRNRCEERGYAFFETDLRWGVTSAEADAGRILPICLEQIDRCRPFILGIIGRRYGGSAENATAILSANERYRPLLPYAARGVTELELRYAILNRPDDAPPPVALLYGRPGWEQAHNSAQCDDSYAELLTELAAMGIIVRPTAEALDDFARHVRDDLLEIIEERMPRRTQSPVEAARAVAGETARLLQHRLVELPSVAALRRLVARKPPRVALCGGPGSGKTMLAAALSRAALAGEGGWSVAAALRPSGWGDWTDAFAALARQLGVAEPQTGLALRDTLASTVSLAAARQPVLVIIDGVEDRNLAPTGLPAWLPDPLPGATVVVSLRAEIANPAALRRAGWETLELGNLKVSEGAQLVEAYFAPLGRRLDLRQIAAITSKPRSLLEFGLLLEEIRWVPRFEALDPEIGRLTGLQGLFELLESVVARLRAEHGSAAQLLLSALALAPDGLSELVLRLIVGNAGVPLPGLRLAILRQAIDGLVVAQGGRLALRSSVLRELVVRLLGPDTVEQARLAVIGTLSNAPEAPGACEEVLRHLLLMCDWDGLARWLLDPVFFDVLSRL